MEIENLNELMYIVFLSACSQYEIDVSQVEIVYSHIHNSKLIVLNVKLFTSIST